MNGVRIEANRKINSKTIGTKKGFRRGSRLSKGLQKIKTAFKMGFRKKMIKGKTIKIQKKRG